MSTYLYLKCTAHTPHIQAENESGQHLHDLPRLREQLTHRENYVTAINAGATFLDPFTVTTANFLAAHPQCSIAIIDEYGVEHPVTEETQ